MINFLACLSMTSQVIFLFSLITISGFIGGIVNYFMIADSSKKLLMQKKEGQHAPKMSFVFWRCVIVGLGASILVPLFLQMISSNLVQDVLNCRVDKIFVFVGFCVVASIFSRRFIVSIGEKLLKELEETKQTAEEAKQIAEDSDNKADAVVNAFGEDETISTATEPLEENYEYPFSGLSPEIGEKLTQIGKGMNEGINGIIKAFQDRPSIKFRSLNGISKDSGFTNDQTKYFLDFMQKSGLVRKVYSARSKSMLYALTSKALDRKSE